MKNLAARVNVGLRQLKMYLQCTQDQLKTHLASQFHSGMSLMNYGVLWNLDHCVPVSFARDNLKALCHYSNIIGPLRKNKNAKMQMKDNFNKVYMLYLEIFVSQPGHVNCQFDQVLTILSSN
ncbi:hypothetical protein PROFUN_15403 [Planoprotostelium fungivorum]|uniref:Uncharacterized protein n=1 Tax=Planoprotostelium fungivorum TaxID=1890364 RepID=A0A2P6MVG7_9EUKA|nr:hypothetical protein PROFUN_15403 [Planoprotostelium fungivorum]